MKYLFVFGNTPDLAKAELEAVLSFFGLPYQEIIFEGKVYILETEKELSPDVFNRLGGTVKIGEIINKTIVDNIKKLNLKNIDFGVSDYNIDSGFHRNDAWQLPKQIKRELTEIGIKSRFVLPRKGEITLSSVVVRKQLLTEFVMFGDKIAKTIWVQDFEDWGKRDYGRPQVEAHVGMLPPKVARMMINISKSTRILDPFCGTGTILMEGCELGLIMTGSDIDPRQISRTKANLESFNMTAKTFVADARKIKEPVDAIVTEADLGPKPGLDKLYIECFQNWKDKVKTVVIALPSLNVIDKVKSMGYTLESGPFIYARPQAKVKRHILVFKNGTYQSLGNN